MNQPLLRIALGLASLVATLPLARSAPFGIRVVDAETGRGVPLVELRTVSELVWWSDSSGWTAIDEPALWDRPVWFHISSPGYAYPKDGFGNAGTALKPQSGQTAEIRINRILPAERWVRLTGEGIHRDAVKLGQPVALAQPLLNAQVTGQDSTQVAAYRGRLHWFWGDTNRQRYPLGHFGTSGATSMLEPKPEAIDFQYFTDKEGFSRPVFPLNKPGVVWIDGVCAVPDASGTERLLCHYSHRKGLAEQLGHGIGRWNDEASRFEVERERTPEETWRHPLGQALRFTDQGVDYIGFANPFVVTRVPARAEAVADPSRYEALAWVNGEAVWQSSLPPMATRSEREAVKAGRVDAARARVSPVDAATGKPIDLHVGSVFSNAFLRAWVMIANQHFGDSVLGEVYFLEAPEPTGPWRTARKVATHGGFSFYNPVHHPFLDREGGRVIHFEGTFTETFSGLRRKVPLYEYNQLLYRLDLGGEWRSKDRPVPR